MVKAPKFGCIFVTKLKALIVLNFWERLSNELIKFKFESNKFQQIKNSSKLRKLAKKMEFFNSRN